MPASVFHRVPLFVSDHQVHLISDAQAVLEPTAPGSTEIARALYAEVVMVPGAGHYPRSQQPGMTTAAVLRFLESVKDRG